MSAFATLQARLPARYVIKDIVGSGGMGTVYLVRDRLTGTYVALKHIYNPTLAPAVEDQTATQDFRTAITHEFRTLATLRHPNIVSVLDYGFDSEGVPYFTMEWLSKGMPLLQACLDLPRKTQFDLFAQLLRGLYYVHRRGVIHRDLKPSNILVVPSAERKLQVKVLDFGLSISTDTGDDGASGTLAYLAPELLRGESPSPAADLYAVGVLLYELLAGQQPFTLEGQSVVEFVQQVLKASPHFPIPGLAPAMEAVLQRLLAKNPLERYPNARALILALADASGFPLEVETRATRASFVQAAQFVGRDAELEQLRGALASARAGAGSAWLLMGEAGVGKSRLLDELRVYALINRIDVMVGQAREKTPQPYSVWFDPIRTLLLSQQLPPEDLAILDIFDLDLTALLEHPIPPAPELRAAAMETRLREIVHKLVQGYGRPLLLILEDLQWATEESLALAAEIASSSSQLPLLLVATYRQQNMLPVHLKAFRPLLLEQLSVSAVAQMLAGIVGSTSLQPHFVERLHAQTEGNAFFLTELLRGLADRMGEVLAIPDVGDIAIPQQVQEVLAQRFQSMTAPAQALLEGAALVGREINPQLLERVFDEWEVELLLQEGAEYHVTEWRNGRWRFTHDQLQQWVAQRVPSATAMPLHASIAESMEALSNEDSMGRHYIPRIAYHWEAGGKPEKALPYLLIAAQDAFRIGAMDEALSYVTQSLGLLQMPQLSLEMARKLMDALYLRFYAHRQQEERQALSEVYQQALALAQRADSPDLYLRAYQLGADAGALNFQAAQAQDCARQMLNYVAPGSGEAMLAYYRLSQGLRMDQRFAEAIQVARQALRTMDRKATWRGWNFPTSLYSYFALTSFFESAAGAVWAMATTLAYSYLMQGDYQSGVQALQTALEETRQVSPGARLLIALHNVALVLQGHGDIQEALALAQELAQKSPQNFPALTQTAQQLVSICEARQAGELRRAADTLLALADTNFAEQEIEDGILCVRDALHLYRQLGDSAQVAACRQRLEQHRDPLI